MVLVWYISFHQCFFLHSGEVRYKKIKDKRINIFFIGIQF